MERYPMTREGLILLENELKKYREERPRIIQAIDEARGHGDLKENAEYHSAKERQALVEGQISDLEAKISLAMVIDQSEVVTDHIQFGAYVKLVNCDTDEIKIYHLVGEHESDINLGKINYKNPLGSKLINKEVGMVIDLTTPKGLVEYEILEIDNKPIINK